MAAGAGARLVQALHHDIDVDEIFGPATEGATRDFQRARQLVVGGVVGRRTRAAMAHALGLDGRPIDV